MKVKNVDSWREQSKREQHKKGASEGVGGEGREWEYSRLMPWLNLFYCAASENVRFALLFALHIAICLAINFLLARRQQKWNKKGVEGVKAQKKKTEKNVYIYLNFLITLEGWRGGGGEWKAQQSKRNLLKMYFRHKITVMQNGAMRVAAACGCLCVCACVCVCEGISMCGMRLSAGVCVCMCVCLLATHVTRRARKTFL